MTSVTEATTVYADVSGISENEFGNMNITVFPNPASDLIAIQIGGIVKDDLQIKLMDLTGKIVLESKISQGSTISYFDTQSLYEGTYIVQIINGQNISTEKVIIMR